MFDVRGNFVRLDGPTGSSVRGISAKVNKGYLASFLCWFVKIVEIA